MASSANALQAAIYARLSGDATLVAMIGSGSVFDRKMTGKAMPYVMLGDITTSDFEPGAEEHLRRTLRGG
jgi:predicted ABC-class ATPase